MILESSAKLAKKTVNDLSNNVPFKYTENLMFSILNTIFSWILSKTNRKVTVNTDALMELSNKKNIVLLPTHRSFYDFMLICKLCAKYKSYGLSIPLSFATTKFKQSPTISMCMSMMLWASA